MPDRENPNRSFFTVTGSAVFAFRALLIGIGLSTGIGVTFALSNRPAFVASFPRAASPGVYGAFFVVAAFGIVALIGLWGWRRWALTLYAVVALATLAIDRLARAPAAHEAAVVTGATAIFLLAYINRERFRSEVRPAGR